MNVYEVEARMVARISGLEEEESRMQEWLECLRKLAGIADQWQSEPITDLAIKSSPAAVEEVAMASALEAIPELPQQPHELPAAEEEEPQMAEDPFEVLRKKLTGKAKRKSRSVFSSGLLFGANA